MFLSIRHEIFTLENNEVALNKNDDKRIAKKDLSWSPTLRELFLIEKR